jgi:hypothetical protein
MPSYSLSLPVGNSCGKFSEELPSNANALMAAISYFLKWSSPHYDLQFCQVNDGEKTSVMIPGYKKAEMETQIFEYLSKLFEFNLDSEAEEIIKNSLHKIDGILFEALHSDTAGIRDKIADTSKIVQAIKSLEEYCTSQTLWDEIDESIFVKNSSVVQT